MNADRGFDAQNVLSAQLSLSPQRYSGQNHPRLFYRRLLEEVGALPGVRRAGIVSQLPVTSETSVNAVLPKESPEIPFIQRPVVNFRWASSDYFRAVGIPLVAGRIFQESDGDQRVVVLTERLAWRLWPNQDPIGREIRRYDPDGFRVVGIVRDVPAAALDRGPTAMVYFPYWQRRSYVMNVVVRAGVAPSALAGALRRAILQLDPEVPISELRTLEQLVSGSVDQRRFQMTLLLSFALLALLLACCGIYGVVAYSVTRRTGEIGIRAALGASRGEVCAMVLRQGLVPVAFGLLLGLGGSLAAGRAVSSFLYGTQALDPLTYGVVTATLGAVAFAACYAPALRASRIDPATALRYE
jgi:putative ABC transport system permease protein